MTSGRDEGHEDLDRNLAFLAYILLFFAFFFAGAPALVGVAIAYSRRSRATALAARHHSYQIWVFWIGFGLGVLASACGLAAVVMGFSSLVSVMAAGTADRSADEFFAAVYQQIGASHAIPVLLITAIVLLISTGVWMVGASAYGFFRLASNKPVGQASRP